MARYVETDTGPFVIVPVWLLHAGVTDKALRLYAVLGSYADRELKAWPSRQKLADRMGCSAGSLDRALRELESVGAVQRIRRTDDDGANRTNIYRLYRSQVRRGGLVEETPGVSPVRPRTRTRELDTRSGGAAATEEESIATLIGELVGLYMQAWPNEERPTRRWLDRLGAEYRRMAFEGVKPDHLRTIAYQMGLEMKNPAHADHVYRDFLAETGGKT